MNYLGSEFQKDLIFEIINEQRDGNDWKGIKIS